MPENVIPFRNQDRFGIFLNESRPSEDESHELTRVGSAYLKPGSKTFRLKIWTYPSHQYFLCAIDLDPNRYTVLCVDEYVAPSGELRTNWNQIGQGLRVGDSIQITVPLWGSQVYLKLFSENKTENETQVAA